MKTRRRTTEPESAAVVANASAAPAGSESTFDSVAALPSSTVPGGGGGEPAFETVTVTDVAVATFPAASRATAVNVCEPFVAVVVSHPAEYAGPVVSSAPRFAPSSLNCTPATPTLSDALAVTATLPPETVAPDAGAESATVGAV